jgi:hypothetical protein
MCSTPQHLTPHIPCYTLSYTPACTHQDLGLEDALLLGGSADVHLWAADTPAARGGGAGPSGGEGGGRVLVGPARPGTTRPGGDRPLNAVILAYLR